MFIDGILFAQKQDPNFSDTIRVSFGKSPLKKDLDLKFNGIFNYFSSNIKTAAILTFTGNIVFVIFEDRDRSRASIGITL